MSLDYSVPLTNDDGFCGWNSSTKIQAKTAAWSGRGIDPVSSKKTGFFLESLRQERKTRRKKKARETERMRESSLYLVSTHTIWCGAGATLNFSRLAGRIFCQYKELWGQTKYKRAPTNKNTYGVILQSTACRDFSFPHRFLLLLLLFLLSLCGFHLLSLSFHIGFWFSPDRDDENEDARQKRQKTVERKWPNNVDRKIEHETFSWDWPDVIESSIVVSAF